MDYHATGKLMYTCTPMRYTGVQDFSMMFISLCLVNVIVVGKRGLLCYNRSTARIITFFEKIQYKLP